MPRCRLTLPVQRSDHFSLHVLFAHETCFAIRDLSGVEPLSGLAVTCGFLRRRVG
jgi:hypothetical protein